MLVSITVIMKVKKFIGGVWEKEGNKKEKYLFISLQGKPYNAYKNENKTGNQPDYKISVFEEAGKEDYKNFKE